MTDAARCSLCGLTVPGARDAAGRCPHCAPGAPGPTRSGVAATSLRHTQPPGAAALCRRCGTRLMACYPGQQFHPSCDPAPPGWTPEQLARWCPA